MFFAFACGEAKNKTLLSVFICGQYVFSLRALRLCEKNKLLQGGHCPPLL